MQKAYWFLTTGPKFEEVWSENGGELLYRASLSAEEYTRLLDENGLKTLLHKMQDAQCGDATVWIAQK